MYIHIYVCVYTSIGTLRHPVGESHLARSKATHLTKMQLWTVHCLANKKPGAVRSCSKVALANLVQTLGH